MDLQFYPCPIFVYQTMADLSEPHLSSLTYLTM